MTQPIGFRSSDKTLVCILNKVIYGFKQAPRKWFERLKGSLIKLGFQVSKCDNSLFFQTYEKHQLFVLVYVDDIIVTRSSTHHVQQVINDLSSTFAFKQLGPLDYFLGIEVKHRKDGSLFLSQSKYIRDLLDRANLSSTKAINTPMASNCKLTKHGTDYFEDPTFYRSIVGALQYATITRPNITYSVNKVCQFLDKPLNSHWTLVKRILRHLQGTKSKGLTIITTTHNSALSLVAYCDADWAYDIRDRKSTSGACLYLGPNLVTWWSKKQNTISRSSTEAEYRSLTLVSQELI
ncbi:PREDICTED: uncharacterized protein LOC109330901 [Lupinus angustifolius]|uniref:uncharacterized protein LOC109330901 n=1 Tax=Lupinus angustifolius TaxID=3871 RepID=UPI00092F8954|nr:PREDICTED: uncharacterized protein LOC109330901 [Lupinus angustifolius]